MSTKEAIEVVMKNYEEKRKELREYRKKHRNDKEHDYLYYHCGNELHQLSNNIGNLMEFSKLF